MIRKSVTSMIKLSEEQKKAVKEEITAFYQDVRGEDIGIIEQQQLIDLFLENLAPIIYDKALDDAKRWFGQQMENLEMDYYSLYKKN